MKEFAWPKMLHVHSVGPMGCRVDVSVISRLRIRGRIGTWDPSAAICADESTFTQQCKFQLLRGIKLRTRSGAVVAPSCGFGAFIDSFHLFRS